MDLQSVKQRFGIIGSAHELNRAIDVAVQVAPTDLSVLITGESGVGKESFPQIIHQFSHRKHGPYIAVNCGAIPEGTIDSELFGHEKGSFTGALADRKGYFEVADGGTIFLDEVGELSLQMQAKLLRVLQERTFDRVGGNKPVKVDIRIIAATNRDLSQMVQDGTFREDLYYRLNVIPIIIPPLRERSSDIIILAEHFVSHFSKQFGKDVKRISTPVQDMLLSYSWPGNVRELENIIERAVVLSEDNVIHGYDLPLSLQTPILSCTAYKNTLEAKLDAVEYEMIVEALANHKGNMSAASSELGLTRRILGLRMEKFGINYKKYR